VSIWWSYSDFFRMAYVDASLWRFRWKHCPITGSPFHRYFTLSIAIRLVRIRSPTLVNHVEV